MKKITVSLIISVMTIFGITDLAMGQVAPSINPIKDARQNIREEVKQVRQNVREEVKDLRQGAREEIKQGRGEIREINKQNRDTMKQEFEAKRMEAKNLMESKKEEFKNKVEVKREEAKSKIEAKKEELKGKLTKIKDERKKQVVEKIYNQVNELNKRRLEHFSAVLEKLEKVLDRISNRAAKAEANGRDISAVKTAITEATNAIALSRTAIQNQTVKVYAPVISTESALKTDIGEIRKALHNDLAGVQETVKTAQEAVKKAATTLAQIPKVDELEVTVSTPETPTSPVTPESATTQPTQ